MNKTEQPVVSKKQLFKSIIIATLIGGIVFTGAILLAEYGKDPLGTGELFGFCKLHIKEITNQLNFKKIELADVGSKLDVPKPIEALDPALEKQFIKRKDSIILKIQAKKGIEYKIKMLKYGSTKYEWHTENKELVFLDFHGEVDQKEKPKKVFYESYTVAYSNNMAGTFTAPFKGKHGWYFKNLCDKEVTITINLEGEFELFDY